MRIPSPPHPDEARARPTGTKWRLLMQTAPIALGVLAVKLFVDHVIKFRGVLDFSDIGLVLSAGVFLIALMLSGTMSDYKESEKIPADLACTLSSIETVFEQISAMRQLPDSRVLKRRHVELTTTVLEWIRGRRTREEMNNALGIIVDVTLDLDRKKEAPYSIRLNPELNNLRRTLARADVISRTGFLASGYALLESVVVVLVILILACRFKGMVDKILLVPFVTSLYVYMLKLIRDIDDPFEYDASGEGQGAEVELFPLVEYLESLEKRVVALEATPLPLVENACVK